MDTQVIPGVEFLFLFFFDSDDVAVNCLTVPEMQPLHTQKHPRLVTSNW